MTSSTRPESNERGARQEACPAESGRSLAVNRVETANAALGASGTSECDSGGGAMKVIACASERPVLARQRPPR
jgi:hypothetical protein